MKNKFTPWLVALAMLVFSSMSAQITSEWLAPSTQGNDFDDIEFFDANVGIAVANGGGMVRTTDGGTTWDVINLNVNNNLTDIFWLDANNVYVGANSGYMFKSADAGVTWTKHHMSTANNVGKIHFVNATTGFATDSWKNIMTTNDGGLNWEYLDHTFDQRIMSIFFTDENNGVVVGQAAYVAYTTDGGATWTSASVNKLVEKAGETLNDVTFTDADNGAIVGLNGVTLYTTNGGQKWNIDMSAPSTSGIDFNSIVENKGVYYATTSNALGVVYTSVDGGAQWNPAYTQGPFSKVYEEAVDGTDSCVVDNFKDGTVKDLSFAGDKMVAVSWAGAIGSSTDAGATWTMNTHYDFAYNIWINSLAFSPDGQTGYTLSNSYNDDPANDADAHKTTDGGKTWTQLEAFTWGSPKYGTGTQVLINPNDPDHALFFGREGRERMTKDGGLTFGKIKTYTRDGVYPYVKNQFDAEWINDSTIVVIGADAILMSIDTANTFQAIFDVNTDKRTDEPKDTLLNLPGILSSGKFIDSQTGFAVGRYGTLIKTTDGGDTWMNISDNLFTAVCASLDSSQISGSTNGGAIDIDPTNSQNIIIGYSGSRLLYSHDGGDTWALGYAGNCNDVHFLPNGAIWLTGTPGAISFDKGVTFSKLAIAGVNGVNQKDDLFILNETTLFESGAVGSGNGNRSNSCIIKHTIVPGSLSIPEESATNVIITQDADSTGFDVSWTRGNGAACAVFMRVYDETDTVPTLYFTQEYAANPIFGKGAQSADKWSCVYNGTDNSVKVTELKDSTKYTVFVAEYNAAFAYNMTSSVGNAAHSELFFGAAPDLSSIISDEAVVNEIAVYPNPTTSDVMVSMVSTKSAVGQVSILDISGRTIMNNTTSFVAGENSINVDLSSYTNGIYFVKVKVEGHVAVERIVKQ